MSKKLRKVAETETPELPIVPKRRRRRLWLLVVPAIAALLWAAPVLIAQTPVKGFVLNRLTSDIQGDVTVSAMTLDWLSPVVMHEIAVIDRQGRRVIHVPAASTRKTLLEVVTSLNQPTQLRIERPVVEVTIQDAGSNLEDVLREMLNSAGSSSAQPRVDLEIIDGTVRVIDAATKESLELTQFAATLHPAEEQPHLWTMRANCVVASESPGRVEITMSPDSAGRGQSMHVKADGVPLDRASVAARRFVPQLQAAGVLSANLQITSESAMALEADGQLTVDSFALNVPEWFGSDRLTSERIAAGGQLAMRNGAVAAKQILFESDAGSVHLNGTAELGELADKSRVEQVSKLLFDADYQLACKIDVAKLAQMLPTTLRVREGHRLVAGTIDVELNSNPASGGRTWAGRIESTGIEAEADGHPIRWEQPLQFTYAANQTDGVVRIDDIACRSDFLTFNGSGTIADAKLNGECDLDRLSTQLSQFFDMQDSQLGGKLKATLAATRATESNTRVEANFEVERFQFAMRDSQPWNEPRLTANFVAEGTLDGQRLDTIHSAALNVVGSDKRFESRLREPVAYRDLRKKLAADVHVQAPLASLQPRVRQWLDLANLNLSGDLDASSVIQVAAKTIQVDQGVVTINRFRAQEQDLDINEARVEFKTSGTWDRAKREWRAADTTCAAGAVAFRMADFAAGFNDSGIAKLSGNVAVRGNLDRLEMWLANRSGAKNHRLTGTFLARLNFAREGDMTNLTGDIDGNSLALWQRKAAPPVASGLFRRISMPARAPESWQPLWQESQMTLTGRAGYQSGADWTSGLNGDASLRWPANGVNGLASEAGQLTFSAAGGRVEITPIDIALGNGRVKLAPHINLQGETPVVRLDPGMIAENVNISKEMCATWLKYVAPMLSEATRAEGRFSTDLKGCVVPLSDPYATRADGTLLIESAQVGPGPLASQLMWLADHVKALAERQKSQSSGASNTAWLKLAKQDVAFRVADRRVHHRGLELLAGDVVIRTEGSVGFDESLSLVAIVPIREEWTQKNRGMASLRGHELRVPIGGTLDRPQLDTRVLSSFAIQLTGSAAKGFVQDQFDKQFGRILGRD